MEAKKLDAGNSSAANVITLSRYYEDDGEVNAGADMPDVTAMANVNNLNNVTNVNNLTNMTNMKEMIDVTFASMSYRQFREDHKLFLVRTEVEGIQVCLIQNDLIGMDSSRNAGNCPENEFLVAVFVDRKKLSSDVYKCGFNQAYEEYLKQVRYVRNMFAQSGRREIFYFQNAKGEIDAYCHG